MRVLVVDNYDSFVFNLVQYLGQLGVNAAVWRNDDARLAGDGEIRGAAEEFDGILLSPGPGTPERAGASIPLVRACAAAATPLLGVCLGHQAIGVAFGGTVDRAPELLHGKTSSVYHSNMGVLQGLPDPFTATRYHSLTILPDTLPEVLQVTARTEGGVIMGVQHVDLPISSTPSRSSPRAVTGCWPTGWRCVARRPLRRWWSSSNARSPIRCGRLLREAQRNRIGELHRGARRRALRGHRVTRIAAVLRVGKLGPIVLPPE